MMPNVQALVRTAVIYYGKIKIATQIKMIILTTLPFFVQDMFWRKSLIFIVLNSYIN